MRRTQTMRRLAKPRRCDAGLNPDDATPGETQTMRRWAKPRRCARGLESFAHHPGDSPHSASYVSAAGELNAAGQHRWSTPSVWAGRAEFGGRTARGPNGAQPSQRRLRCWPTTQSTPTALLANNPVNATMLGVRGNPSAGRCWAADADCAVGQQPINADCAVGWV